MLTAWRRFEPNLADDGWLDVERRMNAVIRQEARERHLTLVEASDVLSGPEEFTDWVHFTTRGANLMANLIADQLVAHDLDNIQQPQTEQDPGSLLAQHTNANRTGSRR